MAQDESKYVRIWEFRVKRGSEERFERFYGPEGAWARLFKQGEGYRGTRLLRDVVTKGHYLTLDFWASQAAYEAFHERHTEAYRVLDQLGEALTERETSLGSFLCVERSEPAA